ncbi:MAG: lysine transporter LysE [Colwelliaceae bacterium]|nr:lysine transporter LysE [Colwelliaceae bacterium]
MSLLISMVLFSLSMSVSPGPVNFLALNTGLNFGFFKSLTFVLGATLGFTLLLFAIGLGLGQVSQNVPMLVSGLKVGGCIYLFYIGFTVFKDVEQLRVEGASELESAKMPGFWQGWLLQWLNPKAWMACIAGCTAFNVYDSSTRLSLFLMIYFVVCFIGIATWAMIGNRIKTWLNKRHHLILFNRTMGTMLCGLALMLLSN